MVCMLIVAVTTILVCAATCTQVRTLRIFLFVLEQCTVVCSIMFLTGKKCITCGCCGGSFDMIASIAYWIEVALSIVAWSFAISVVTIVRDEAFTDVIAGEAENIGSISGVEEITDGNFLYGFWLFIFCGTFVGSLCAIFAGWAAEGSCLGCFVDAVACLFCCKKK